MASVKEIDALLPQTQCGECGFPGCRPYAEALASAQAPIDRCPPGGVTTLKALSKLLNRPAEPFLDEMSAKTRLPARAVIHEEECIGCTKCIQACPVDAIIGTGKLMHAIIADECTGCGLCVEPCPVDCIELIPEDALTFDKGLARSRFQARNTRLSREDLQARQNYREKRNLTLENDKALQDKQAKQNYILEALARVKAKKS